MSRLIGVVLMCSLAGAATASAQVKTIPGEHRTVTATVEAVDVSARELTLRMDRGEFRTIRVPEQVKRLGEIHPGDTVTATYYDNLVLRLKPASEADVDTLEEGVTVGVGPRPVGTSGVQQTITATIDAIDLNVPSISLKGPRGWAYKSKVEDKKALAQVKVGDRVDVIWTEATLVSVKSGSAK